MSKQFFKRQLDKIKTVLSTDSEVVELANKLLEKIESSQNELWAKLVADKPQQVFTKEHFIVPPELLAANPLALTRFALFCDGGCRGNPGPGAWGALGQKVDGTVLFELTGLDVPTTNNKMELEGAIQAMQALRHYITQEKIDGPIEIHLYSDSKYVVEGLDKWIIGWKARGWKKSDNKVPENMESWMRLDQITQGPFRPICHWVKGHDGHPQNEYCDQMINKALDEAGF